MYMELIFEILWNLISVGFYDEYCVYVYLNIIKINIKLLIFYYCYLLLF